MVVHGPYPTAEPRVVREARAARAAGWEVDVVCALRTGEPRYEVHDGVAIYRLPIQHQRGVSAVRLAIEYAAFTLLASIRVLRLALKRRYRVVQIHNPPDFLVMAGVLPRVLLGARLILDVHDLAPDMFAMRFGDRRSAPVAERLLRRVERRALAVANEVITVHEPYRQELIARGCDARRVTVVMNSLDDGLIGLTERAQLRDTSEFRVVYHGTITPHYGVDLILRAVALTRDHLRNPFVEILGEGDAVPSLQRLARELGVDDIVSIPGTYVPHDEALRRIRGASVGVVPNLPIRLNRFALSTKLLEYVALGIPAISADLDTLRAHFTDDEVAFFRAGDAKSLADAVLDIARRPEAARSRVDAARRRYTNYDWAVNARRYVEVLGKS